MARMRAGRIVAFAALLVVLAGCGGSKTASDTETAETTTAAATTTAGTTTAATTTAGTTTQAVTTTKQPTTIRLRVVGGKPQGGIARPDVEKGERVVLVVTSDVDEEVHLHGYDLMKDVAAGSTIRIPFVAGIQGRFEVELEHSGVLLAEVTVR